MSKFMGNPEERKRALKELIRRLHEGADPQEMKARFEEVVGRTTPAELARIEEELIKEGMPREEIQRLCDVHLAVFRESLEKEKALAPAGHPIEILMKEHALLLEFAAQLRDFATGGAHRTLRSVCGCKACCGSDTGSGNKVCAADELPHIVQHLKSSESHYVREENVLFPYLEKHGITEPPAIMWMDHNRIREIKKQLYALVDSGIDTSAGKGQTQLKDIATGLLETISAHFYKENNILFPTAMKVVEESEWPEIRRQFDEIGYCCFTPEASVAPLAATPGEAGAPGEGAAARAEKETDVAAGARKAGAAPARSGGAAASTPSAARLEGALQLETGSIPREAIEALLNTLPIEMTFVDDNDTVRFYSEPKERIFPRTKAVIGRKVQLCHPQTSVHVVNQLLEDLKSGKHDVADFWIKRGEGLVYIRYFAVRDKAGKYLGCLEVSQDVTEIRKLAGEKRLL